MSRALSALCAAAMIGAALTAPTAPAEARDRGAVAAGIIGGVAAGTLLGAAIAQPRPYYAPAPVYVEPEPVYVAPPPPRCFWARGEPEWDGYRWVRPRMRVCE